MPASTYASTYGTNIDGARSTSRSRSRQRDRRSNRAGTTSWSPPPPPGSASPHVRHSTTEWDDEAAGYRRPTLAVLSRDATTREDDFKVGNAGYLESEVRGRRSPTPQPPIAT